MLYTIIEKDCWQGASDCQFQEKCDGTDDIGQNDDKQLEDNMESMYI